MEELIELLKKEASEGAELETLTVVLKRNYRTYVVTRDDCNRVYVYEV